jgi:5-formyltetrahydrofolate cyclo-ligase
MTLPEPTDLHAAKALMRSHAVAVRRQAALAVVDAGARLAEAAAALLALAAGGVVAGYWPIGDEIDARPLLARLAALGAELALPVVTAAGQPLDFRRWRPGEALVKGAFGTSHPADHAPVSQPRLLLLPLLAFDDSGFRLGYGGGYYDRTLDLLRARAQVKVVGLAYAAQRVAAVPHGRHDQRLDGVATEDGLIGMETS